VTTEETDRLVERLGQARLGGLPLADAVALLATAYGEAGYDIQTQIAVWFSAHGQGELAGYKIGATAKGMQEVLGVPRPVYGHILSGNVLQSSAKHACNPDCRPGIECEIAFRLGEDLTPSPSPFTRDHVARCIDAVIPAIEIVENRYGDFRSCSLALLTADDFFHKACVLGEPVLDWRGIDLPDTAGRTSVNGEWVETGQGRDVLGHPLDAVVWLANKLAERDACLKAGQIILTGSMTPVHWINSYPSEIKIEINELGDSSVTLTGPS
jgi:2-oxo-3-hexenedioate decarboxylase/2-keto-4-pentenoate hydratase